MFEELITATLAGNFKPQPFIEFGSRLKHAAEDVGWKGQVGNVLQSPIAQYALLGGGIGGAGSLLRSMFGNTDPETEGSSLSRFLRSLAMGGVAGAGVAGGAKMLGYDMPQLSKMLDKGKEPVSPRWQTSAGVGILGGLGTVGIAALLKKRAKNVRMMGSMGTLIKKLKGKEFKGLNMLQTKKSPGPGALSDILEPAGGVFRDQRGGMQKAVDFVLGRNAQLRALQGRMRDLEFNRLKGNQGADFSPLKDLVGNLSETAGPVPGSPGQQMFYGGLGTGALHQMLGEEEK